MLNVWLEFGIIPPQAVIDFSSYPDTTVCTE
jgi:hypothetical protein